MPTRSRPSGRGSQPQPGDDDWEPTGLARPAYQAALAITRAARSITARLADNDRLRDRVASGPVLLAIGMSAWTLAGALSLLTGHSLFITLVYAATSALCTTMTVLMVLLHAAITAGTSAEDVPS